MENTKNGSTINKALMLGTAVVALNAAAMPAAYAATDSGSMTAVILAPVTVTVSTDIDFGTFTVGGTAGVVPLNVDGTYGAITGSVTNISANGVNGVLSVTGATGGPNVVVSMTAGPFTVNDGGGNTMAVTAFNIDTNAGGATLSRTLTASPSTIPFAATLNVGANQVPGSYTGTYTVNANY